MIPILHQYTFKTAIFGRLRYTKAKGVFRWAIGPWPSALGRQGSIISIEKYAKLWHGPPFFTWAEGLSTETVGEELFLAKNRSKFE